MKKIFAVVVCAFLMGTSVGSETDTAYLELLARYNGLQTEFNKALSEGDNAKVEKLEKELTNLDYEIASYDLEG